MRWIPLEGRSMMGYPGMKFVSEDERYTMSLRLVDTLHPGSTKQNARWTVHDRHGGTVGEIDDTDEQSLFIQANDLVKQYERTHG